MDPFNFAQICILYRTTHFLNVDPGPVNVFLYVDPDSLNFARIFRQIRDLLKKNTLHISFFSFFVFCHDMLGNSVKKDESELSGC